MRRHRTTRLRRQARAQRSAPHRPPEVVRAGSAEPASGRTEGTQAVGRIRSAKRIRAQVTHHVRLASRWPPVVRHRLSAALAYLSAAGLSCSRMPTLAVLHKLIELPGIPTPGALGVPSNLALRKKVRRTSEGSRPYA